MQDDAGFSSRVSLNAVSNILRTVIVAVTGLLLVPFYIGELGFGAYAVVFLATTVSAYFSSASEAVSQAFTRYLVLSVRGGGGLSAKAFSTVVSGMLRCVLVMLVLCAAVSFFAPYVFDIGQSTVADVQTLFITVFAAGLVMAFVDCLGGVFVASNRLYVSYVAKAAYVLIQAVLVVSMLVLLGPRLSLVGISSLVSAVICLLFVIVCIRRALPEARFSKRMLDCGLMKEMGGLGAWSLLCEVGSLLFINASLMMVNVILGNEEQATFSIATNVSSMIGTVSIALAAVSVPLLYKHYSDKDVGGMASMARLFMKASGVSMAFFLAFLAVFAPQAIEAWIGPGHDDVADLVRIIMPAEVIVCATGSLVHVPVTFMRLKPVALAICALGAFNVAATILVLEFTDLGMPGACIVWSVAMILLRMVVYPVMSSYLTGARVTAFLTPIALSLILYGVSVLALYLLSTAVTIPATIVALGIAAAVLFVFYMAVAARTSFDDEEKKALVSFLPEILRRPAGIIIGMKK